MKRRSRGIICVAGSPPTGDPSAPSAFWESNEAVSPTLPSRSSKNWRCQGLEVHSQRPSSLGPGWRLLPRRGKAEVGVSQRKQGASPAPGQVFLSWATDPCAGDPQHRLLQSLDPSSPAKGLRGSRDLNGPVLTARPNFLYENKTCPGHSC